MSRARRWTAVWAPVVAALLAMTALVYVVWGAFLFVLASEGSAPPERRDPDIPTSAHLVGRDELCGSGGCSRRLRLYPAEGQTPAELAKEMGLTSPDHQGWRWYDPTWVSVSASPADDLLDVSISYRGLP